MCQRRIRRSHALVHLGFHSGCPLHHLRSQPRDVPDRIPDTFPETFIVRRRSTLERFGRAEISTILHENLRKYGCVNARVVTFEPRRLTEGIGANDGGLGKGRSPTGDLNQPGPGP